MRSPILALTLTVVLAATWICTQGGLLYADDVDVLKLAPEAFLKRFDKNHDGRLAQQEVPAMFAEAIDKADLNKDGFLDQAEVAILLQTMRQMFENPPHSTRLPALHDTEHTVRTWHSTTALAV